MELINVYCDESCHLENDGIDVMVLGAIWVPINKVKDVSKGIKAIKIKHGLNANFEAKWSKVSKAKVKFYTDLIEYFFSIPELHFRSVIIKNKFNLDHNRYNQDHGDWYFKMYFEMLKTILDRNNKYQIYLDIKDSRSSEKVRNLHDILCRSMYDFDKNIVERLQTVRSHEIEILQIVDLLIGALSYTNRNLYSNAGKVAIVKLIQETSGYNLTKSTLYREDKLNLFVWTPKAEV